MTNINPNEFFSDLENTRPYLKLALEGFSGSGKTFTAVQIAIGLYKKIKSKKPIVVYDTERAFKALKPFFSKQNIEVKTRESRSLVDLVKTIELCKGGFADILIIDSITHVWETFVSAFREEKKRTFIQFQDWGILKPKWKADFSDRLVLSNLHIIFTGRAGYEYDNEMNEATGKKELIKTGIKMKVENETEYEPDIVVLMEKEQKLKDGKFDKIIRTAKIIKDRTTKIDGKLFENPTFKEFEPAIKILLDGESSDAVLTETKDSFEDYEKELFEKKDKRVIYLEEIEGILTQLFPGSAAKEKRIKLNILEKVFKTTSWKAIEKEKLAVLEAGTNVLKEFKQKYTNLVKNNANDGGEITEENIMSLFDNEDESEVPLPWDKEIAENNN